MRVDFMIIGAQKCGTTSLAAQLAEHPEICFCKKKEPGYFHRTQDWEAGLESYHKLFSPTHGQICGEASTMYTFLPEWQDTPLRLFEYNPELKLLYIMRNPVERVMSNYAHDLVRGHVKTPPEIAVFQDPAYINRSRYGVQIRPYLALFKRENILLLLFEEYVANQPATLKTIAEFLGVSASPVEDMDCVEKHRTVGEWYWKHSAIMNMVGSPAFEAARKYLPTPVREVVKRTFSNKLDGKPALPALARATLWRFLEDDVSTIEELLGRRLDVWHQGELA